MSAIASSTRRPPTSVADPAPVAPGPDDLPAVRALVARATAADGVGPLSERFRMGLGRPPALVWRDPGGGCAAYGAVLDDGTAELVVDPDRRRRGLGSALFETLRSQGAVATVWAHGDLPPARHFADRHGLSRVRTLHRMARPLGPADAALAPRFPAGYALRSFRPGNEDAWLVVNAAAFADHPEQGRVDRPALDALMREDWFAPEDLLLLWGPDGELAGSHWTKIDPSQTISGPAGEVAAGEVYVVAVAPGHQGRGLAGPLTGAGLAHLARRGLTAVVLYVDEENAAAMRTYRRLGFRTVARDALYALP